MQKTETRLRIVPIVNGAFTDAGNYTAYDATSERYHITSKKASAFGLVKDAEFKPFFATIATRTYNKRDKAGNIIEGETFERQECGGLFWELEQASDAVIASELAMEDQDTKIALVKLANKAKLKKTQEELGLSTEDLQLLMQL